MINKRLGYSPGWIYRNPKIGFYSINLHFPCLIFRKLGKEISINFYAWSDFWLNKSQLSLTISITILGFGFKFHHRNKELEYGKTN